MKKINLATEDLLICSNNKMISRLTCNICKHGIVANQYVVCNKEGLNISRYKLKSGWLKRSINFNYIEAIVFDILNYKIPQHYGLDVVRNTNHCPVYTSYHGRLIDLCISIYPDSNSLTTIVNDANDITNIKNIEGNDYITFKTDILDKNSYNIIKIKNREVYHKLRTDKTLLSNYVYNYQDMINRLMRRYGT